MPRLVADELVRLLLLLELAVPASRSLTEALDARSGNVTLHCENALDTLTTVAHDYPSFDRTTSKARLLLMTTEPDALSLFEADTLCTAHFTIAELSRGGSGKPFLQDDFRHLSEGDRRDDTQRMLVQTEIMANWVDAAVMSANSNTGRALILLRGGPARAVDEYRLRSVDLYWHVRRLSPSRTYSVTLLILSFFFCTLAARPVPAVQGPLRRHLGRLLARVSPLGSPFLHLALYAARFSPLYTPLYLSSCRRHVLARSTVAVERSRTPLVVPLVTSRPIASRHSLLLARARGLADERL